MRFHPAYVLIIVFAGFAANPGSVFAQRMSCNEVHAMGRMARAKSVAELNTLRAQAGKSYRADLVFAFRAFELRPIPVRASAVLDFLPHDESHQEEWYSLSGWICDQELNQDVNSLARLEARIPHDFAQSVILSPERMFQYVSYALILGLDPHDDFAEQTVAVCRRRHREFLTAVNRLPEKDRDWFLRVVFQPTGCIALAHPEAD